MFIKPYSVVYLSFLYSVAETVIQPVRIDLVHLLSLGTITLAKRVRGNTREIRILWDKRKTIIGWCTGISCHHINKGGPIN